MASPVTSITIESERTHLGDTVTRRFVIRRTGHGYVRDDGSAVSTAAVAALVDALQLPTSRKLPPYQRTILASKLAAECRFITEASFGAYLRSPSFRSWAMRQCAGHAHIWTFLDDWYQLDRPPGFFIVPDLERREAVEMRLRDGRNITAESFQGAPYMIPWVVADDGGSREVADLRVPYAVLGLTGTSDPNLGSLDGSSLLDSYANEIMNESISGAEPVPPATSLSPLSPE